MADPAPLYLAWSTWGRRLRPDATMARPCARHRAQKTGARCACLCSSSNGHTKGLGKGDRMESLSLAAHKCPVRRRGALNRLVQHRWRLQQQACPNARALSQSVHSGHQKPSLRGALAQKVFPSAIALSHWPRVARKAIGRQQARASKEPSRTGKLCGGNVAAKVGTCRRI